MKILIISDLHLCDRRHYDMPDEERLEKLAAFIRTSGAEAVLNLGDTVSRKPFLLEKFPSEKEGFGFYLNWRRQFSIPFAECAIERELPFFAEVTGQKADTLFSLSDEAALITACPLESWRSFTTSQLDFLHTALDASQGKTVIIGTHLPYPGSCSRNEDVFLQIPESLQKKLAAFPGKVFWCGGHFHWDQEPPKVTGSLIALYPSRFRLKERGDDTYTTLIDTVSGEFTTNFHDF